MILLGIYKILNSNYNLPINIGNPNECSINELIDVLNKLIKNENKILYLDLPENDPKKRKPDISLAKKILGWQPKISLIEGLRKTITYFYNYK